MSYGQYFAYGSNMNAAQMTERCPDSKYIFKARLPNFRLDFTTYSRTRGGGAADVVPDGEAEVWGLVYELTEGDLKRMDKREGPNYRRSPMQLDAGKHGDMTAWVYEVINKQPFEAPTVAYRQLLIDAAIKHQFPQAYVALLEHIETR